MRQRATSIGICLIVAVMYATPTRTLSQNHDHDHAQGDGHDHKHGEGDKHEHGEGHGDHPEMSAEDMAMMAEWARVAAPSDAHKHLDYFVGTWKTKTKIYMGGPGSTPMESDGQSVMKWVLDGRFIMDEHTGTMMGMPYNGIGMTGYDNYRNLYTSSWCSNQGTNMLTMSGMRHPKTGVFTYYGEMDEPNLKVIGRTVKYVTTIIDADHYTFEIIDLHAGDNYKVIELAYERVK